MLLKEFDLDAPQSSERTRFRDETRCVTELFEHCFGRFETSDCWKILVEVVPEVTKTKVRNLLGAYTIQVKGDPDSFFALVAEQKKRAALRLLLEGVGTVCRELNWDSGLFSDAATKVEEAEFVNVWVWSKPKTSPDRRHVAEVLCEHDIDAFRISIVVKDRDGEEVRRELVVEERPNDFLYDTHLGTLKWLSSHQVALLGKGNGEPRVVELPSV